MAKEVSKVKLSMQIAAPKNTAYSISLGIFALSVLIGGTIRVQPALLALAPLNDGGLFYQMTVDLVNNSFRLPEITTFNAAQIPYAYPPFAFYLAGFLHHLFGWSLFDITRILPAIIGTLTIIAFGLLAVELLENRLHAAFATLAFALLPRTFDWIIMGGGLTRSFGFLFSILVLWQIKRYFRNRALVNLVGSIIFSVLTLLSHPEAVVHTTIGTAIIFWFYGRKRRDWLTICVCAVCILAFTSPWWGFVLSRHGLDPFLAARANIGQDTYNPLVGLIVLFRFYFTDEPFINIFAVIGLIGIFGLLVHNNPVLPIWLFITHLIEPRGGALYMMLPLALCCGYAICEILLPALGFFLEEGKRLPQLIRNKAAYGFFIFLLFYGLFSSYYVTSKIASDSLTSADLEAFKWVKEHTSEGSRFLILTGANPLHDSVSEWFPALTERRSLATIFGLEWINGGNFTKRREAYDTLQGCRNQTPNCIEQWAKSNKTDIDYIYIYQTNAATPPLIYFVGQDNHYQLVYKNSNAFVYKNLNSTLSTNSQ